MGEAKRRKKLDPSYGKPKVMVELTILDFAVEMYRRHGKGIVYLHNKGVGYVLPSHSDVSDTDEAMMNDVDYKTTFVITMPMAGSLFTTGIFDSGESIFARKFRTTADWVTHSEAFIHQ